MKKIVLLLSVLPSWLMAQSVDQNYIKTTVYKDSTQVSITSPTPSQAVVNIAYLDGLGRGIQQRAFAQSGTGKDIVKHIEYDALGRRTKDYMPYVPTNAASLNYDSAAKSALLTYYANPNPINNGNPSSEATTNPYVERRFESSPLNRVLETGAPGNDWVVNPNADTDHTVKYLYTLNTAVNTNDKVKLFTATASWNTTYNYYGETLNNAAGTTYYAADKLSVSIWKDENWVAGKNNTVEEYRNAEGQLVLKRAFNGSAATPHDTYYVYDQFGNLAFVLPPTVSGNVTSQLNGLCYQYRYDDRNRLVEKKDPGKQWEFRVYDFLGRVVATGPARSPFTNFNTVGWLITKYDAFDRAILTGWVSVGSSMTSSTRKTLQAARDTQTTNLFESKSAANTTIGGVAFRYTSVAYPTSGYHVLTVNYYDNYDYSDAPTDFTTLIEGQKVYYNNTTRKPKGLATGLWVRVLQATTNTNREITWIQYDYQSRAIRTKLTNHLGGYTLNDRKLGFIERTEYTTTRHKRLNTSAETFIKEVFTYTPQERLIKHTHQIGLTGTPQLLAFNTYDELGQLVSRKTGGTDLTASTYWQKVDFKYTVRGWLKGINDISNLSDGPRPDLFAYKLNYTTTEGTTTDNIVPLYNGNIAETYWRSGSDNVLRKYGYRYDKLNRLEKAIYQRPASAPTDIWNSYNEEIAYDKAGNITSLLRWGGLDSADEQPIDELAYEYEPLTNKLLKVTDKTASTQGFKDDWADPAQDIDTDYSYDLDGNMISDQNKKITLITYNHLNLPVRVDFGMTGTNYILYTYDAAGVKVNKTIEMWDGTSQKVTQTEYLSGFQYADGNMQFFGTAQGYVRRVGSTYKYIYNFTDQTGNVRMSYGEDPAVPGGLAILEENHYYPYGLKHQNYNIDKLEYVPQDTGVVLAQASSLLYKYKFNGMEWQEELGLNTYDMALRQFDSAIGRWTVIDPVVHFAQSTYNGFDGNPVFWADPSGGNAQSATYTGADAQMVFGLMKGILDQGLSLSFDVVVGDETTERELETTQMEYDYWTTECITGFVQLPTVNVSISSKLENWDYCLPENFVSQIQSHVYANSKYYSYLSAASGTINFGPNANRDVVSDYSISVLHQIMSKAKIESLTIGSTARSPRSQARVMFYNIRKNGIAHQKALYGPNGDKVIDCYPDVDAMYAKIMELGPGNVSHHCANPSDLNVIDISPSSISDKAAFINAVRSNPGVTTFWMPPGDPAFHLEIPQN